MSRNHMIDPASYEQPFIGNYNSLEINKDTDIIGKKPR